MSKMLRNALLGIVITSLGLGVGYVYLAGYWEHSPVLLIASLLILAVGFFFLYTVGKSIYTPELPVTKGETENKDETILDRNNRMMADWDHTNTMRDRLKMLQIQERAEEQAKSS